VRRILTALALAAAVSAAALPAAAATSPPRLKACFGNKGVEFGNFSAWLCEVKLGDNPSGSLYYSPSVDNGFNNVNPSGQMIWYKLHAAPNAFYAWENYSQPWWKNQYPRSYGRIIMLDEGPAGQCLVAWPRWDQLPTRCTPITNGGATIGTPHRLTQAETYSVMQYAANAEASIPPEYR
jgi:hypothetical protein